MCDTQKITDAITKNQQKKKIIKIFDAQNILNVNLHISTPLTITISK